MLKLLNNIAMCSMLVIMTGCPSPKPDPDPISPEPVPTSIHTVSPGTLYGVTLDNMDHLADSVAMLKALPKRATVRVVFDENVKAADYVDSVMALREPAYIMGELLDSYYMKDCSLACYKARTADYLSTLKGSVDIWEIGNEVNGEWLGSDVVGKITAAYDQVKAKGYKTALNLYYNAGCFEKKENEMFTWAQANIPARMLTGLDYVFFSYYEDDCNGLHPNFNPVFTKLAAIFPNALLGFGEVGTKKATAKAEMLTRYYTMSISEPHYVLGGFWWYGYQDLVPMSKPLWSTLAGVMK